MRTSIVHGAILVLAVAGCASRPPRELVDARSAYQAAASTRGSNLAQTDLYEARQALGRAEASYNDVGNEKETRDLAYVAERRARLAQSRARTLASVEQARTAEMEMDRIQKQRMAATQMQLERAKGDLARQQQTIEAERQARAAADQKAKEALSHVKDLQQKEDQRGLVLTLGSGVLFGSGKSDIMPAAQKRLSQIADVIAKDDRPVTIVGHTDATGTEDKNEVLSRRRADAVRSYLVAHGVPEDRVKTEGVGSSQPIADDKSAEGRATNRRVEIILGNQRQEPLPKQ